MPVSRVAWIVTVLVTVLTAVLLLLAGYVGYAGLSLAVGASAAINLL
jgi:ABC-type Fe3+-siderophore transport system permease subunit